MKDARQHAPATVRNREPIAGVLRSVLPRSGLVLEVASGTGEHAVFLARRFPGLTWQPSDPHPASRQSIVAWTMTEGAANVMPPLDLDAASDDWPIGRADAIVCVNMIHISPWAATEGLMRGAGRILERGAPLYLYGPYRIAGQSLEPGNREFDLDLRRRNPAWGLRELGEVAACAAGHGLRLEQTVRMPANNLSVVFRMSDGA